MRGGLLSHLHINLQSTQNTNPGEDTPEKGGVGSQRDTARHLQGSRGARARSISSWISEPRRPGASFDPTDNLHKQGTYYLAIWRSGQPRSVYRYLNFADISDDVRSPITPEA